MIYPPRLLLATACALLFLLPPGLRADSHGSGSFTLVDDRGTALLALDLQEDRGRITGAGLIPAGGLAHGPGVALVRQGNRLGQVLLLTLWLEADDPGQPPATARLTIRGGTTARLLYDGGIVTGALMELAPDDLPQGLAQAPAARPAQPASPDAPRPPAPSSPVAPPAPAPQSATQSAACAELERLTNEIYTTREPAIARQFAAMLGGLGLGFGVTPTQAQCARALTDLTVLLDGDRSGDSTPGACRTVAGVIEQIRRREAATNTAPNDQVDLLMTAAGMRTGRNPGGADTEDSCARALTGLYAYRDGLAPMAPRAPSPAAPAAPRAFALPEGYRAEPLVNINRAGGWRLAAGGNQVAVWQMGPSRVAYEKGPGTRRTIWYWIPDTPLERAGVQAGTLFFEGRRTGDQINGEARHVVPGCGAWVYPVTGRILTDETSVRFDGNRPVVNAACQVTGLTPHRFWANFARDMPPGVRNLNLPEGVRPPEPPRRDPQAAPFPAGGGVWAYRYALRNLAPGGAVNLRRDASSRAPIVGRLPAHARDITMRPAGCRPFINQVDFQNMSHRQRLAALSDRWCRVRWRDREGWVYGRYLRPM